MNSRDDIAETLDLSEYDTQGFCPGYTLLRHRFESLANDGCHEARTDWIQYIGTVAEFGGCNPLNGNFTALVLPLCKPERLQLVAYVLEYAFLHDNVVEVVDTTGTSHEGDEFSLGEQETRKAAVKEGRKQIQAKMMLGLTTTDKVCAERVMDVWKTMLSTTLKDKTKRFANLEEYLDFRIIDTGAPFVESIMLFGMAMTLTKEEDEQVARIIRPCYAALALANDYFSFDREWQEAQEEGASKPLNAVWLYMQWEGVGIAEAKHLVRKAANHYEREYLDLCNDFKTKHGPLSDKLDLYLKGLSYQVSGNVVWSLNCPRYHPEHRYDPNAGLEDMITSQKRDYGSGTTDALLVQEVSQSGHRQSIISLGSHITDAGDSVWSGQQSRSSSVSDISDVSPSAAGTGLKIPLDNCLGAEYVQAPFEYTSSLPSKGVRGTFIDALNLWAGLSDGLVSKIKGLIDQLHTASLMFDDIEDGSDLRRGHPAAHSVFGVPQTINAASCAIVDAISKANELDIPGAVSITLEQLRELHIGQSYDLYWTRHSCCPSEAEYLEMVSKKTGGLFRLLSRLMSTSMSDESEAVLTRLVTLVGIFFQIRDDYQNLASAEYTSLKGFCEDLDEGKLSYPLMHYLNNQSNNTLQVREVLQQRRDKGSMSTAQKQLVLKHLTESKSLDHTKATLQDLERQITGEIGRLEVMTGKKNWILRLCMQKLAV